MKKYTTAIVGAIAMIATAIVFLLLTDAWYQLVMCWLSLSVILLLEFATTALFMLAKGSPRKVGGALAFLLATLIMMPVSGFFLALWPFGFAAYFTIFVVLAALCTAITVILWNSDAAAVQRQAAKAAPRDQFRDCRNMVMAMVNSPAGKPHAKLLQALEEELRYTNDAVFSNLDEQIVSAIEVMPHGINSEGYDLEAAVQNVIDLLKQRNYSVRG